MGRTLSRDELRTLLDQVTRDITNEAGVVLRPLDGGEQAPGEDLYTVYITFNRGINSRLALCAGMSGAVFNGDAARLRRDLRRAGVPVKTDADR